MAERLSKLGFKAVDTDDGGFSVVDEQGDQHWDVDRLRELLATEDADVLFVVGSDDAQVLFYPDFDHIVLLSAPREVMVERLTSRTNNAFGKSSQELAKVLADLETFEPFMRRDATYEIDTNRPLDDVSTRSSTWFGSPRHDEGCAPLSRSRTSRPSANFPPHRA